MFRSSYLKRYRIFSIFLSLIFILGLVANSPSIYVSGYTTTEKVEIESPDYDELTLGSWHIDKSAKWVSNGKAKVNFDVNTTKSQKQAESTRGKDVLLVLDVSDTMNFDDKLTTLKEQGIQLIDDLLPSEGNRVAIIAFNGETSNLCARMLTDGFINDRDILQNAISDLSATGQTDYHAAFVRILECLEGYVQRENTDLNVLFITDGLPNINCDLQIGDFKKLKEKYPYATIHGLQFCMGSEISERIKLVSDLQSATNKNNFYECIHNAAYFTDAENAVYDKFEITDYIDSNLFLVNSVDDIKVDIGNVELKEENGQQKIIWKLDGLLTGKKPKMEINMNVRVGKEGGYDGFFPTNTKAEITSKLSSANEIRVTSEETPVLKNYKVHYNANRPTEKAANYDNDHTYCEDFRIEHETVEKNWPEGEKCSDYLFRGWKFVNSTLDKIINYAGKNFIMPDEDVYLNGTWGKFSVKKSMYGLVARFIAGPNVDIAMKQLAAGLPADDTSVTTETQNTDIKKFTQKNIAGLSGNDEDDIAAIKAATGATDVRTVYDESKDGHIYIWCEEEEEQKIIYWASNASVVELNPDSSEMFKYLESLTELDVNEFDTSNVTNMFEMFSWCLTLPRLNLSNFNTSKVTNMQDVFKDCRQLTDLDISSFDTSNVTNMQGMFFVCHSLTNLDLRHFNTSNVTNMKGMFQNCIALTNVDVSSFDTSNVTNMRAMFHNCRVLTEIDVSNFETSYVENMGLMFAQDLELKTIYVSQGFALIRVQKTDDMFTYSTKIVGGAGTTYRSSEGTPGGRFAHIDRGSSSPGYFSEHPAMFATGESINSIMEQLSGSKSEIKKFMQTGLSKRLTGKEERDIAKIQAATGITDIRTICDESKKGRIYMWYDTTENRNTIYWLTSVSLPNNIELNPDSSGMFSGCDNLTDVDTPWGNALETSNITNISNMFSGCKELTTLNLRSLDTSNVTDMSNMFSGCSALTTIYIRNSFDVSNVTNSANMFNGCTNLVGGAGTTFDSSHNDKTYAHIDGGVENPGYFTAYT